MSNQVKAFVFNPADLPEGPYLNIAYYLDKDSLNNLSLVSRKNYNNIYKIAIEALIVRYKSTLPPRLLTFSERSYPHSSKPIILGNNDDLELLQKRNKNTSFASNPEHSRFLTVLNTAFPERLTYAEMIEKEQVPLAQNYQKWIREEIFVGSTGLEVSIFLQNIRQLIQRYQADPPSILQILQNAQAVFPSESLTQLINLLKENPRIQIFEHPTFRAFQEAVNSTLNVQHVVQKMKDVEDGIASTLNEFRLWNRWADRSQVSMSQIGMLIFSLQRIAPSMQFLLHLSPEIFADQFALSESESLQLRQVLTLTLGYYTSQQQAILLQRDFDAAAIAEIDVPGFMSQLNSLVLILQKGVAKQSAVLNKRNQHTTVLWRGIFLEDRESLRCMIDSPAFLYFQWREVLKGVLRNKQFDLFLHLISYPQILDSLSPAEFKSINYSFLTDGKRSLDKYDPSVLLPLLRHSSVVTAWENFNHFEDLTRSLLPFFLGGRDISPLQWVHLCSLNLKRHPSSKILGITLNALVRERKTDLIRMFLELPDLQKDIPSTSSSSNPLIHFFLSYPLLWDRLCCHHEEGAQLLAQVLRDLGTQNLHHLLGPATCAEIIQFFLAHPEMIQAIAALEDNCLSLILSSLNNFALSERLDSLEAIQQALQQAVKMRYERRLEHRLLILQPTINALAGILFAHDRYLLRIFVQMSQKERMPAFNFEKMFKLVQRGAPLLATLSKPSEDNLPKETPYKTLDLLSAMGAYLCKYRDEIPTVGWDMIFQNAAAHPPLLDLLASYPTVAVQMPQNLRNNHLPQALQAHAEDFQAFPASQEGSSRSVAERIGRLMETYPTLIETGWKILQENCSFFRRVALTFKLPKFLSSARYNDFYKDLPFFYRVIGQVGKLWARFFG